MSRRIFILSFKIHFEFISDPFDNQHEFYMNPLPKLQILSLYRINLENGALPELNHLSHPADALARIVRIYNHQLEENHRYQEVESDPGKLKKLKLKQFQIKWWISTRNQQLSGASQTLTALAKNRSAQFKTKGIKLGAVTEHHLIFLFRQIKQEKTSQTAKKADRIWEIFALTTNDANYVIRRFADFSFPLQAARRICDPAILNENKIPIGGDYLSLGGEYKKEHLIAYSSLESLSQIIKGFKAAIKTTSTLYENEPFSQFVKKEGKQTSYERVKVTVGEMYLRFQRRFTLEEHVQICAQLSTILDPSQSKDDQDEAFEYFDHIRRVPKEHEQLTEELETAMLKKVFTSISGSKSPSFEFYHHHYHDYADSTRYCLRGRNKQKAVREWAVRPSAEEILQALKSELNHKTLVQFIIGIKGLVFDFHPPTKKRPSTYSLIEFFKGEVFHNGKQYFYLDGRWCEVEGEYYSFVQNEFLLKMQEAMLPAGQFGALPLPWVSKKKWVAFSLADLKSLGPDQHNWKSIEKKLLGTTCSVTGNRKKVRFLQKGDGGPGYTVGADPEQLSKSLKKELGEQRIEMLKTYYTRLRNYCEKEENYNRRYLFDVHNEGVPFGNLQGYLVFDQVYPSVQQKIELFDVAFYHPEGLFLYHVKEQMGQKTRDACSQIRTAAAALSNALSIGGRSDVLSLIFDQIVSQSPKSEFPKRVKEQLESFGKTRGEQKQHFLSLFQRDNKQIAFVYAFLDDGAAERNLHGELQRSYRLDSSEFGEQCRSYQGEKKLTRKEIMQGLVQEGFLDSEHRITDQFIGLNKANDFTPRFLKGADKGKLRKKNRDAIFKVLQSHLSQFNSFIAKKELLDTKRYVESLGFSFKINQIYRDGLPAELLHFEETGSCIAEDDTVYNWKDILEYDGQPFLILRTSGGGACALHALNGTVHHGEVVFCHDRPDPHLAAKQHFIDQLQTALDEENDEIKQLLICLFADFLKEYWSGNDLNEPNLLYGAFEDELIPSLDEKEEIIEKKRQLASERADVFWSYLKKLKQGWKDKYLKILRTYKTAWKNLETTELLKEIESDLSSAVGGCWSSLYKVMGPNGKEKVDPIQSQIDCLSKEIGEWETDFASDHFDNIWEQYVSQLTSEDYYLSEQEIEIAAIVYEKKNVRVVSRRSPHDVVSSQADPYNPSEDDESLLIYHQGNHFSQCHHFED